MARNQPEDFGFGVLFSKLRDVVVVLDVRSGHVVLWNPAAEILFGYTADEAVGMPFERLVPPERREQQRQNREHYLATGHAPALEADTLVEGVALRKDGERVIVEVRLTALDPRPGDESRYVLAVIRDVTERVRRAEERDQLLATTQTYAAQLEVLARLRADFGAMVAHELGGSLVTIRNLAAFLTSETVPLDQQHHMARLITQEAESLLRLADDVATAATAEREDFAVDRAPVPVAALIDHAIASAHAQTNAHPVAVETDLEATVFADPARIGQVLRNLVENAAKHTPRGTPITVRARQADQRVRIEVADQGPGIDPDELEQIFEKFARTRATTVRGAPGAGLGLYLARRIVRAHGSELTVHSAAGAGAVFGFDLELAS
ncbi:MAG: ATP-binding protein [Chloroflexota bacterium]|nr:ATP-binding protein [Chloroflexota bacterium]